MPRGHLPDAPAPVGNYLPFVRFGNLIFLSAISSASHGELITGKVGLDLGLKSAGEAAARAARNLLSVLTEAVDGDLDRVEQLLIVRGYVNATEQFSRVHQVIDAASAVLIAELGQRGRHARTSVGCAALPNGNAVTLEAIAAVRSDAL
jgi:enamine deaminase RidA (YjgF/YER057c/UK114 family)